MPAGLVLTARFSSWKATIAPASSSPCVPVTLPLITASCALAGQGSRPSNAHNVARGATACVVGQDDTGARRHTPPHGARDAQARAQPDETLGYTAPRWDRLQGSGRHAALLTLACSSSGPPLGARAANQRPSGRLRVEL